MLQLTGLGVSDGIAIGRAVCLDNRVGDIYRIPLPEESIDDELERFHLAAKQARQELGEVRQKVGEDLAQELGGILDAHILLLKDPALLNRVEAVIRGERVNAEWAIHRTTSELSKRFDMMEDEYLRERNQDLLDVGVYLLRVLQGIAHHELSEVEGDIILVAHDLTPSEAVRLGRGRVSGFAIESGGRTSHTTIIARSLKTPAVGGLEGITDEVTDEDPMIVDGRNGLVILHPTQETLDRYRREREAQARHEEVLMATRHLSAETLDHVPVELMANIDLPEELEDAIAFGAAGIGLYRSEFLYIEKDPEMPTEEEHLEIYRRLLQTVSPHPVIVRTYDLGGRKLARELLATEEQNPVLGLRGIRLTMARPEMFRVQLRALYRAAAHGDLRIMLPMISSVGEVRAFRRYATTILQELQEEGIEHNAEVPLGIMVEVPAAAQIADLLAREVDFFSIGTNDLIQYSLAVDRNNEHVADLYQPLHPAILRMLRFIIESAQKAEIEVGLCGEMAADARLAVMLLGLGLRRLSISPRLLPEVKTRLRGLTTSELTHLAQQCLTLSTADEVESSLDAFLQGAPVPSPVA
ncbi:MAG: phosphoenolpyruvate--protein phosphotransferase [Acidobacteriota bacterium]